jgi:uncharacterized membrane protein
LAGPYGRPLHPLLVTVPVGAFATTLAFDVASVLVEGRAFGRAATWLSAIGVVTGLLAAVFGFVDYRRLTTGTRAHATAVRHMILMDVTLLCFVIGFFVRRADPDQYLNGTPPLALLLSIVGSAVLLVGAWIGGRLTYSDGVRVADERDQLRAHVIEVRDDGGAEPASE